MLLLIISFFSFFLCWLEEEIDGVEMSYLQILSVDAEQKRLKDLVIAATRFVTSLIINLFNFLICNYYSMTRTVSILFWLGIRHWNGGTYMLIDKDIIKLWRKCVNIIPTFLVKCRYTLDLWFLALKLSPKIQINRPNTSELLGNTNFQFFFLSLGPPTNDLISFSPMSLPSTEVSDSCVFGVLQWFLDQRKYLNWTPLRPSTFTADWNQLWEEDKKRTF